MKTNRPLSRLFPLTTSVLAPREFSIENSNHWGTSLLAGFGIRIRAREQSKLGAANYWRAWEASPSFAPNRTNNFFLLAHSGNLGVLPGTFISEFRPGW